MKEPIPVLAYRKREYGRRSFLVGLAIAIIVFAVTSICVSGVYLEGFIRHALRGSGSLPPNVLSNLLITYGFSIARWAALAACAFCYLARSKQVVILLSAYFCISIAAGLISPAVRMWMELKTASGNNLMQELLYAVVGIAYVFGDVAMLMLLRVPEVRKIIYEYTGVREQSF